MILCYDKDMEELLEKVEQLKSELDRNEHVVRIKELNKELKKDTELMRLIDEYRIHPSEELKMRIYSNPIFAEYKVEENEINFLILSIRSELKNIKGSKGCSR